MLWLESRHRLAFCQSKEHRLEVTWITSFVYENLPAVQGHSWPVTEIWRKKLCYPEEEEGEKQDQTDSLELICKPVIMLQKKGTLVLFPLLCSLMAWLEYLFLPQIFPANICLWNSLHESTAVKGIRVREPLGQF